jgi:predicted DNA-binding protein
MEHIMIATTQTFRDKLDYLVRATGRAEADIVAEAVEAGLTELYRQ